MRGVEAREMQVFPAPTERTDGGSKGVAVFCRETLWDSPLRISTNSIARQFAKDGWRVGWIVDPICPLDFRPTASRTLRARVGLHRSGGRWHGPRVFEYCPLCLVRAGRFWPLNTVAAIRGSLLLTMPPIPEVLRRRGLWPVDVLVIASRSAASALRAIAAKHVLYHAHDFFADRKSRRELPGEIEAELVDKADLVVAAQELHREKIIEHFGARPEEVVVVPFASDPEMFARQHAEGEDLAGVPRPRVVLLGTPTTMDLGLIAGLAERRSDVSFVHVGPEDPAWARVIGERSLKNLYLLGPKDYEVLPHYLPHCDVGLAPYRSADVGARVVGGFYMKIYDYAAAGLPIVVTEMPGYSGVRAFMFCAKTIEGFSNALDRALGYTGEQYRMLKRFSLEAGSWTGRYKEILHHIGRLAPRRSGASGTARPPKEA